MNQTEREAIILNCAWGMVDGMVNWSIFVKNDYTRPTNLMFQTAQHAQLFAILLGDFLSQVRTLKGTSIPLGLKPHPANARPSDLTFIYHLRQVCADPKLGEDATTLRREIEAFADWLEGEFVAAGVNLHSIDIIADLHVSRYRYLKMCGDIAKHNLARLETNAAYLRKLLASAGHTISEQEAYLAIDNFFDWFHRDIFIYHSSQIAEFLNNIRLAIFDYLQPEFNRSWHLTEQATPDFQHYSYKIPERVIEPMARAMYWDAMNRVRAMPWMHRFIVSDSFKQRY